MNIFALDKNPVIAAKFLDDVRVVKMITESNQMLSTAHRVLDGEHYLELQNQRRIQRWCLPDEREKILYKASFWNHPCSIWVRESSANYKWLIAYTKQLCKEYTKRYKKVHRGEHILNTLKNPPQNIEKKSLTDFAMAMPEQYQNKDTILAYRTYYVNEKMYPKGKLSTWRDEPPFWLEGAL